MRKISPKTVWCALISVIIIMVLGACMKPVDVESFLEDETVQDFIDSMQGLVRIDTRSDGYNENLKAGNSKISGLKNNKYYMIETEKDKDGEPVEGGPWYVTDYYGPHGSSLGPGGLAKDLDLITRISGGRINGLENDHIYRVKEATVFSQTTFYYSIDDGAPNSILVDDSGIITIPPSAGKIYLVNLDDEYDGYDVMAVAVNSTTPVWGYTKKTIIKGNGSDALTSFQLEEVGTTVDYVFVYVDKTPKPVNEVVFKVLTVKIAPVVINIAAIPGVTPPVTGRTPVTTIIDTDQYTGIVTWSPTHTVFAASTVYTAAITLTPKTGYTLQGVPANFFTVAGATATNPINSGVITAVFAATGAAPTGFTIELEETIELMNVPTLSGPTLTRGKLDGNGYINITLAAPKGGGTWTANSIVWSINAEIDAAAGLDSNHTDTLIITNGGDFLPLLAGTGTTTFTVSVTAASGGKPYSAKIEITVQGNPSP
jgi:hypothetical protein